MTKQAIRERIWDDLEEQGLARFPFPPHNRIPNFADARGAAEQLANQPEWEQAQTIKANPDAPQLPVRRRALRDGKIVYMAVPRLRDEKCFLRLDPAELEDFDAATTVSGCSKHGVPVGPDAVEGVDLIVSGSVAVDETGGRIGKGEGYSDLEYAVLHELELVDSETPVATTVHDRQVVEAFETDDHDVPLDLIVTPERVIRPAEGEHSGGQKHEKPSGIDWELLGTERRQEIPVLDRMR